MIGYRPDVDGLRAIAILTVVGCHVGLPGWSGGYVGVDVFFVISGFLITSLLVSEAERFQRIDLWGFYARRVRRLLPAFLTVLLCTLILGFVYLVSLDGEQQGLAKSAVAGLLLNANHYFWRATGGYFDRPTRFQPLLHLWSLSVEEQYYLVWPLGLIGLLHLRPASEYRRNVLLALLLVVLVSMVLNTLLLPSYPSAAFYLMPARAWELAMGAIVAVAPPRVLARQRSVWGAALGFAGLAAIVFAVTIYDRQTPFPGPTTLVPVLGAAAVIVGGGLAPKGLPARLLSTKPMVGIGLVSYSWYLWHWPLLAIGRGVALGTRDLWRDFLLAMVVSFVLACVTYRWIERPIRWSVKVKSHGARATVWAGVLATVAFVPIATGLGVWAKFGPKSPMELRMIEAQGDEPPTRHSCQNGWSKPAALPPGETCIVPTGSSHIDTVLWGDSYADHWMPALTAISTKEGFSVYEMTRDACPPVLGIGSGKPEPIAVAECSKFQRLVMDEIAKLRSEHGLQSVVLSAAWALYAGDEIQAALNGTLDRFDQLGLNVLIIAPSPSLRYKAPECLLRHGERFCALAREDFDRQRERGLQAIIVAAKGRNNVRMVDPALFLCDTVICPAIRAGQVLYTDSGHVAATASRAFADVAREDFAWLH